MFQTLDIMISVGVIFLILSMVLKYWMSFIKRLLNIKAQVVGEMMKQLVGDTTTQILIPYLNKKVFSQNLLHNMKGEDQLCQLSKEQLTKIVQHMDAVFNKPLSEIIKELRLDPKQDNLDKKIQKLKDYVRNLDTRIQSSYNKTMEKISEAYESRMRKYTLISGILLAFIINADFFEIYDSLSKNSIVRDRLAAKAEVIQGQMQRFSDDIDAKEKEETKDVKKLLQEAKDNLKNLNDEVDHAGLNLGWRWVEFDRFFTNGSFNVGFFLNKLLGMLISGFLMSFGAPFWHEFLASFSGVKSMLKGTGQKTDEG